MASPHVADVVYVSVEDSRRINHRDSWSFVLDRIEDAPLTRGDTHDHRTPLWRILDGIAQQIDEDLLDPIRVGLAVRQFGAGRELKGDVLQLCGGGYSA